MTSTHAGAWTWIVAAVVEIGFAGLLGAPRAWAEADQIAYAPEALHSTRSPAPIEATIPAPETQPPEAESEDDGGWLEERAADYDPWEPFNERMFWFNHDVLDRYMLKPVAEGWSTVVPEMARRHLDNAFDNARMPGRFVNNLLQLRPMGAGREMARFLVNTTVGVAGLFDVAKALGVERSAADTGQTLGVYGAGPGPYLALPALPPLTVRDGIGYAADGFLDPLSFVLPFVGTAAMSLTDTVNQRSEHLELFEAVEDGVIDLYAAVRNAHLQRREGSIRKAIAQRQEEWGQSHTVALASAEP